jgi:hypothetical protein
MARGKTFKQATTECMQKLLVLMTRVVARGQVWDSALTT